MASLTALRDWYLDKVINYPYIDKAYLQYLNVSNKLLASQRRKQILNPDFTVISNNCLGASGIYQKYSLQYTTPTVGLWFYSKDYIRFIENLKYYLNQPIEFKNESSGYPIGVLGGDVEIQFMHYKSAEEAKQKWQRRSQRVNFDNLFLIYSDKYGFKEEYLRRFERMPIDNKRKLFFAAKQYDSEIAVFIKEYKHRKELGNSKLNKFYERYVDLAKWVNGVEYRKKG
jgi:uncharacterized protein (DUF1919 family)